MDWSGFKNNQIGVTLTDNKRVKDGQVLVLDIIIPGQILRLMLTRTGVRLPGVLKKIR